MQVREALECCRWSLVDKSRRNLEDHSRNVESKDCAYEDSKGMRTQFQVGVRPFVLHSRK